MIINPASLLTDSKVFSEDKILKRLHGRGNNIHWKGTAKDPALTVNYNNTNSSFHPGIGINYFKCIHRILFSRL